MVGMAGFSIERKSQLEGAASAEGLAVIIDVFRAFSCAPLFFHLGAENLILEADTDRARGLKVSNPSYILVGEADEIPIEGADLTNSPTQILKKGKDFFRGKTVVHRTTAGVAGVRAAFRVGCEVLLGSFVMAGALAGYLKVCKAERITIVAMGSRGLKKAVEDEACADYIEHLLGLKNDYDHIGALREIICDDVCLKFTRGGKSYLPPEDPIFCLQKDLFRFVIKVEEMEGLLFGRPLYVDGEIIQDGLKGKRGLFL